MTASPLVSIIMPVYNGEAFLGEAIASVLVQAHRPLEVIVVDDGSTDQSAAIAERYGEPVRCHRQANAGPPAARNRGLAQARGEIIGFLDADDLYTPDKLTQQMRRLAAHPNRDVVIGRRQYQRLAGEAGEGPTFEELPDDHLSLQLGCALFRRAAFERVGLFEETMWTCDDWDWFMRARELGVGLLLHRDLVLLQRIHTANIITRQREIGAQYTLRTFKRSLERRRRGGAAADLPPLSSYLEPEMEEAEEQDG